MNSDKIELILRGIIKCHFNFFNEKYSFFYLKMNLDENHKIDLDKYDVIKLMGQNLNDYILLIQCKADSKLYSLEIKSRAFINTIAFNFLIQFRHPTFANLIGYVCQNFQFEGKEYNNIPNEIGLLYEFCRNNSLDFNISNKTLNNTQKQIVLVGVSRAISLLHQNNYVHLTITPENILLDDSFHPHLYGFHFMSLIDPDTRKVKQIPKKYKNFTAPEALTNGFYNEKVDIYSFGLVMLFIISENPIRYDRSAARSANVLKSYVEDGIRPLIKETIKKTIQDLIEKCWLGDPDVRPTADELFRKLAYDPECYLDDVDATVLSQYVATIA